MTMSLKKVFYGVGKCVGRSCVYGGSHILKAGLKKFQQTTPHLLVARGVFCYWNWT